MKARVLLRRAAELDPAGIEDWYESQQAGLGAEFREAIDDLFERIGENPLSFSERYQGSRRAILRRFPHTSFGTESRTMSPSSWLAFMGAGILGWQAAHVMRRQEHDSIAQTLDLPGPVVRGAESFQEHGSGRPLR